MPWAERVLTLPLAPAGELKAWTIEAMLAKSDIQLGLGGPVESGVSLAGPCWCTRYSRDVRGRDWDVFEESVAALMRAPSPDRLGLSVAGTGRGVDVLIEHGTGSGKTEAALGAQRYMIVQVKNRTGGFSASARTLTRAGLRTDMRWFMSSALADKLTSEQQDRDEGAAAGRVLPWLTSGRIPLDGRRAAERALGSLPAITVPVCRDAGAVVVDELPASRGERMRKALEPSQWSAARAVLRAVVELALVLCALALAARSRRGLRLVPPPTQPPGQIVRTHPRVPRGPDAALCSGTSWPSGGVLSVV
jgi:hypothetical protein